MTLVEKLSDVRDFRKILETTVKEIGENYSADVCQIVLSNPLDGNFTSICEYISNPEEVPDELASITFPVQPEGGGLGWLSVSRQSSLSKEEIDEIRIILANIADILRYAQINDIVQRDTFRSAFMSEITNLMSLPMGLGDALFMVVNILGKALAVSRCIFVCVEDSAWPNLSEWRAYEYWQRERIEAAQEYGWPTKDSAVVAQTLLSTVPVLAFEGQQNSYKTPVQEEMEFTGVRSQLSVALRSSIGVHGSIILQQCESRHLWTRDEIDMVQNVADTVAEALAQLDDDKKQAKTIMQQHQRDVADTKEEGQKSIQDVRKALKGAMGNTSIKKAQKSKPPEAAAVPPPPQNATSAIEFQPQEAQPLQSVETSYSTEVFEFAAEPGNEFGNSFNENYEHTTEADYAGGGFDDAQGDQAYSELTSDTSGSVDWAQDPFMGAPPEPNYEEALGEGGFETAPSESETDESLSDLANMLEQEAAQTSPGGQEHFKGVLAAQLTMTAPGTSKPASSCRHHQRCRPSLSLMCRRCQRCRMQLQAMFRRCLTCRICLLATCHRCPTCRMHLPATCPRCRLYRMQQAMCHQCQLYLEAMCLQFLSCHQQAREAQHRVRLRPTQAMPPIPEQANGAILMPFRPLVPRPNQPEDWADQILCMRQMPNNKVLANRIFPKRTCNSKRPAKRIFTPPEDQANGAISIQFLAPVPRLGPLSPSWPRPEAECKRKFLMHRKYHQRHRAPVLVP
jgi:GAF domain-containing protein